MNRIGPTPERPTPAYLPGGSAILPRVLDDTVTRHPAGERIDGEA